MNAPVASSSGRSVGLTGDQLGERPKSLDRAEGESIGRGHVGLGQDAHGFTREPVADDERLGLAVVDDVRDLGTDEMPVDRRVVEAALERRERERHLFEAVGQHGRDLIAPFQPERPQPVHDLIGERVELAVGHRPDGRGR